MAATNFETCRNIPTRFCRSQPPLYGTEQTFMPAAFKVQSTAGNELSAHQVQTSQRVSPLNKLLHHLRASTDLISLKSALQTICSEYGSILSLDVCSARADGQPKALCFLRMDTIEQERQIMQALEVNRFSDHLVIMVDLAPPAPAALCDVRVAGHA